MVTITANQTFVHSHSSQYDTDAGWSLTMSINSEKIAYRIAGAGNRQAWTFTATPADTQLWVAGDYMYYIVASDGVHAHTEESGTAVILPDPLGQAFDGRSFAQKMLAAIQATLLNEATNEQLHILQTRHGITDIQQDSDRLRRLEREYRMQVTVEAGTNPYRLRGRYVQP